MLTPDKIKEKSFQTTGRGSYRSDDVDAFLSEVSASYEQMFKENGDLIKKISILAKKIEEYRADEESLKMALFNAQKLADKITAEAKENADKMNEEVEAEKTKLMADATSEANTLLENAKAEAEETLSKANAEAEAIVKEANKQSNEILGNINRKVTQQSLVYEMLQKEASEFKGKLVNMYKEHINLINQLPEIAEEQVSSEDIVEEAVEEDFVVIEEAPETVEVEEEPKVEVEVEIEVELAEPEIEKTPVEEIVEEVAITENVIEDIEEVVEEAPVAEPAPKKSFKLDLSKIDFADDIEEVEVAPAPAPVPSVVESAEVIEEAADDEDKGSSISFKNFFKKK